ncbi:MAG: small basic family protein [Tepidanaerobacteraceae bacterium]|jgi:small basic protein
MIIYPLLGLIIGIAVGIFLPVTVPTLYAPYVSIAVLAILDSIFGGIRSIQEDCFDVGIFLTGFLSNTLLAGFLAYFGDRLGIPIYLAAIFAFGVRIFQNLAIIRRSLIKKLAKKNK